jgi:SAM-dependent methyltransferase
LPPGELIWRVGHPRPQRRLHRRYEVRGEAMRREILAALPGDWSFEGRKVLDFGCGAGRLLRQFLPEAGVAELWGCDIHGPSVEWLERNLCPPLRVFRNDPLPPLPLADETFDLVWALSVFTHLPDTWSAWLLEIHRVLAPGGLFLVTFIGEGASARTATEPWDQDRTGMNVLFCGQDWDLGGPIVMHSPWWIRAHWGRAFDVLSLRTSGFAAEPGHGQGVCLLRKKPVELTVEDLEHWEPGEPRELEAVRHNLDQLERELAGLRASRSWRVTAPLRSAAIYWRAVRERLVGRPHGPVSRLRALRAIRRSGDTRLLVRATCVAMVVPLLMRLPLPALAAVLRPRRPSDKDATVDVDRLVGCVDAAAIVGHPLVNHTCLTRSGTLYWFLARAGMPVELHFGLATDAGGDGHRSVGHAWLSLDGEAFLEENDPSRFTVTYRVAAVDPPAAPI